IVLPSVLLALKISPLIEKISDHKDFKKLLRTRNNVLVLYSTSAKAAERQLKLLSDVAQDVRGRATVSWIDCGDSESRKLCKKMKVDPSSKTGGAELLHYKDGAFHTEYNRPATYKSMVAFLKDPEGAPLWEENPEAKDIVHIDSEKDFRKLVKKEDRPLLVMFYAPKGKYKFNFEKYGATAKDIVDWLNNPQAPAPEEPEVPWAEQESAVHHLTEADFDPFIQDNPSVLGPGALAAIDATVHRSLAERFHVSGFPTLKYFEDGEEKYTVPHLRTEQKILEFMHSPEAPPPPEPAWEDKPSSVLHLLGDDFRETLKKKKHALVMFYAPWCPHCKNAVPDFTTAALEFKEDRKIAYAAVDCTKEKNQELCKQEGVEGFPTFVYFNYGKFIEKYNGERSVSAAVYGGRARTGAQRH
ncbi:hypothetical protein GDO78_017038, partial [Eleutherodactylus coqui]